MDFSVYIKVIQDFSSKWNFQLELVYELFQLFRTIACAIRKGFSRLNLSHRGNFAANLLLPIPSAGWVVTSVYNSCEIHSCNLSLAVPPTQPGQAQVFISCSIPSLALPHLLNALNATAGTTALWLHPKTRAVPKSLEFVVLWEVMDESQRGPHVHRREIGTVRIIVGAHLVWV